MKTEPSVNVLNRIQNEWMALDPHAPQADKNRVFSLMKQFPRCYVSGHDGKGVCMLDHQPLQQTVSFAEALALCRLHGGRTDIAWNGQIGVWYSIEQTATQAAA